MYKSIIALSTIALATLAGGATVSANTTHTVQSGDTLTKIAVANNTSVAQLAKTNGLANANVLSVGQQIIVDGTATETENTTSTSNVYTVKSGDTLNKIAQANGKSLSELVALNNIANVDFITVGQQIKLNADTATATVTPAPATTVTAPANTQTQTATTQTETATAQTTTSAPAQAQTPTVTAESASGTSATDNSVSSALQALINRESSGNVNATNGQYYGIGQLSPQARATYGGNSTDYNDQLNAMKSYISARYGTAENAYAHSNATGWY